ncbi:ead/Ea22-like family protein [Enterobacter roggenkampii]|uniref:ead/Ea22-like family protein n=1 Tax=Enterobacter roggenkampii TaxID=1812935 RepID=UPI00254DE75A|nr:ead/Ea22-like family protein [Enterobacter roggenkampii]MDK9943351.1 ead/Ea22-like family protein [Enterobacter roggenkampii]MDK9947537.1 ead/Ea22-like family protein [Enterobacter roggenkampii]
MSNIDKQALREAAKKAGSDEWFAFIDTKSKTYAVHTPADNRCGDVVKWAGFDGQQRAAAKAKFIAAANPATVLALLDELEAKDKQIAELEAKLETADKLQDSAFRHGLQHGFSLGQTDNQAGFEECLSAYGTRGKDNG